MNGELGQNKVLRNKFNRENLSPNMARKTEHCPSPSGCSEETTLCSVLNEYDLEVIDDLVKNCEKPSEISMKMEYFFGSLDKIETGKKPCTDSMKSETSKNLEVTQDETWGYLARMILDPNLKSWKQLMNTLTKEIRSKLEGLSGKIPKTKFRKVLKNIDQLLQKEMNIFQMKFSNFDETEEEKQLRSCITLYMLLEKDKIEQLITPPKIIRRRRNSHCRYKKKDFIQKNKRIHSP